MSSMNGNGKPIDLVHVDLNGIRGVVLDLEPDSFPGGAELMVFEPGGLARRGSINLVKGAIVMMFDLDICEQLRKALAQAKTQTPPNRGGGIM